MRDNTAWSSAATVSGAWDRLLRALFADRVGLVLFLGTVVLYVATIRVSLLVNDSNTVANALVALSQGDLHIERLVFEYGPGLHTVGGRNYGRNYGQVVLALPFLWLLEAASVLADLRVALAGAWSLLLLATLDQAGAVLDDRRRFARVGAASAVGAFLLNLSVSYPMTAPTVVLALQLSTATVAAATPVVVYRLAGGIYDRRVGVAAGIATAVATPVAFWATYPKRHALVALLAVLVVWSFHRSRAATARAEQVRFRALSYVWVALMAWVHAPEAFVAMVALGTVDLLSERGLAWREILVVGGVFGVALLPFLVTNAAISGNPVRPPRLLPGYVGQTAATVGDAASAGGTGGGSAERGTGPFGPSNPLGLVLAILVRFFTYLLDSLTSMMDAQRAYQVFVRSGYLPAVAIMEGQLALRLSMLESMPLLGGVVAVPTLAVRRLRRRSRGLPLDVTVATDLLVTGVAVLYVVAYWPRIPTHASFTVRYLHPLYPLGVYALVRVPAVRTILTDRWRLLGWSYGGAVLVGGQLLAAVLATVPETFSEAYQLHALAAVTSGGLVAAWALVASARGGLERTGAVVLAVAGAVSTTFLVLSTVVYYDYSPDYALPVVRTVAEALTFV